MIFSLRTAIVFNLLVGMIILSCRPESVFIPEGGYPFEKTTDSNFYYYPVRNEFERNDSVRRAVFDKFLFACYNEPNLSISPSKSPVFRLMYENWTIRPIFITLTESEIIVKQGIEGYIPTWNDSLLTTNEQKQLWFIESRYPRLDLREVRHKKYVDSMLSVHPDILSSTYHTRLLEKKLFFPSKQFVFTTKRISISYGTYRRLVSSINHSGYWKLPVEIKCPEMPTDAGGLFLEAATPHQYNIVFSPECPSAHAASFLKACQELVSAAGLSEKIFLLEDSVIVDSSFYEFDDQ